MNNPLPALGIDVAKDNVEAALLFKERYYRHTFTNTDKGFAKLKAWLKERQVERVHACMEATGRYGDAVAHYLHEQGHLVSVVNPAAICYYARSKMARNKSDRLDAEVIASYCDTQIPRAWAPLTPEVLKLQQILRYLDVLREQRVQHLNRLSSAPPLPEVRKAIQVQLNLVDKQIEQFEDMLHVHLNSDPHLRQQRDLLHSIKGIGELTAAKMLAINLADFDSARAAAAFAGLNPQNADSGKSVHRKTKLGKQGDPSLRTALYMPAMSALRWNPVIKRFGERLEKHGKCKMVVLGAAMRKLLCLAYGVLKSGKPFDPNFAMIWPPTH